MRRRKLLLVTVLSLLISIKDDGLWVTAQQQSTVAPVAPPCNRLLVKGIDDDERLPWIQMAGIYILQNFTIDQFPVYRHEHLFYLHLYYNRTVKELGFGILPRPQNQQKSFQILVAFTDGTTRLRYYGSRPYNPFSDMITRWYQFDLNAISKYVALDHLSSVEPMCVGEEIVTCTSGLLEFNDNLKQIGGITNEITDFNILGKNYFQQIAGKYNSQRPTYLLMGDERQFSDPVYLYYTKGLWLVSNEYASTIASMYVQDKATRPDHIIGKWKFYTNGRWTDITTKLRCRGISSNSTCDGSPQTENPCLNGGTCIMTAGLKVCQCPTGFRGAKCEDQILACSDPKDFISQLNTDLSTTHGYYAPSTYEGGIMTVFCTEGRKPAYWFSACQGVANLSWSINGACLLQTTVTQHKTTTEHTFITQWRTTSWHYKYQSKYIFENSISWVVIIVIIVAVLMQIFNPLLIYYFVYCVSHYRLKELERKDDKEIEKKYETYQKILESFKQQHPEAEDNTTAVCEIHNVYQQEYQEYTDRKTLRRNKVKPKLFRLYSLYSYITWWLWLAYLILFCSTRLFGGSVFYALYIISACFITLNYLLMLLEYVFSSERDYLNNLSSASTATERIKAMRDAQPTIVMKAVCYHYETRTRTVYYTDANGNLQSRIETYQEKVITNIIIEILHFLFWKDTSDSELKNIRQKGITKIKLELKVEPGDDETATDFLTQYNAFCEANQNKDVHVDFSLEKNVPGFEKRLAAYNDEQTKSWWISSYGYLAATLLLFGWPYRFAFNAFTSKTDFMISKLVYTHHPSENETIHLNAYVMPSEPSMEDGDNTSVTINDGQTNGRDYYDDEDNDESNSSELAKPPPYSTESNSSELAKPPPYSTTVMNIKFDLLPGDD